MAKPSAPMLCQNCGATIGKLETPHVFKGNVVCAGCASRLTGAPAKASDRPPARQSLIMRSARIIFGAFAAVSLVMGLLGAPTGFGLALAFLMLMGLTYVSSVF